MVSAGSRGAADPPLSYLGYYFGRVAIIPVLASFGIAYVVNPIVEWFETRGVARAVAALLTLALVTVGMGLFLWFVIPGSSLDAGTQGQRCRYPKPE